MKKGNIQDVATTIGVLFMVVLLLFFVTMLTDKFGTEFRANNETNYTSVLDDYDDFNAKYKSGWDYGFLLICILFPVFSFLGARLIPSDIKYMMLAFFILVFFVIFAMAISNVYGEMMEVSSFATFTAQLTFIPWIMPKLPYYAIMYMLIVLGGLYSKSE